MAIDLNLIDKLLADYKKPEDIIGEHGLLKQLTKALLERAPLETPRDRNGTFEPKIVGKGQTRFTGFDDKIISMYARGMSTREIAGHLQEIYGVELSPTLISNVTEEVMEEVKTWQGRPLDAVYPIVYLDALMVKVRDAGHIRNRAIYVATGVNLKGNKEVLGVVDGRGRRGQVLAASTDRSEEPWRGGHLYRLRGWLDGIPQGHRDGVSAGTGATVHRSPGAGVAELCVVGTAQGSGRGPAIDLSGEHDGRHLFQTEGIR